MKDFFKTNKKDNPQLFNKLSFCTSALEKEIYLPVHKTHLYLNEGILYGTNGHRLHVAKLDSDNEDGFYQIITRTKTKFYTIKNDCGTDYPDVSFIINQFENDNLLPNFKNPDVNASYVILIRKFLKNYINYEYFKNVFDYLDIEKSLVYFLGDEKPIMIRQSDISAYIMPAKII